MSGSNDGRYMPRDRDWQPAALTAPYKSSVKRSPSAALLSFPTSLSEETSPVFGHDMLGALDDDLIHNFAAQGQSAIGPRLIVHGKVSDEFGRPVPGALIEVWQRQKTAPMRSTPFSPVPTPGPMAPMTGGLRISTSRCLAMASRSG